MNDVKYIGLDVHLASISIAVLNAAGKLIMEAAIENQAAALVDFVKGLKGALQVALKRAHRPSGFTDCSRRAWPTSWFAIHARTPGVRERRRVIVSMHGSWPSGFGSAR